MKNKIIFGLLWVLGMIVLTFLFSKSALALSLSVNITNKYLEVNAGERLPFEIQIQYPENTEQKNLRLIYQIKKGDEIISETKALKVIDKQTSFMEFINIPESLENGNYTLFAQVQDYENLNEGSSVDFRVVKSNNDLMKYIYIFSVAIGIIDVLIITEFIIIFTKKKKEII